MKEADGYFTIIRPIPDGKGDTGATLPLAEDILISAPELKAFFAVNDPSAAGCVQAIAAHPDRKDILVYGVDGSPDAKKMIQEGTMTGTGAQSPIGIGKRSAEAALAVLANKPVEANIVIPTFIINESNVDQYTVTGWQ
jgi:ribose transport system substrate-binding protein